LKDNANTSAQSRHVAASERMYVEAGNPHRAVGWRDVAHQEPNERRLSSARRANEKGELAALDLKAYANQPLVAARVAHTYAVQLYDRVRLTHTSVSIYRS
jgi:hypothetical protein